MKKILKYSFKMTLISLLFVLNAVWAASDTLINEEEGVFYCAGGAQSYILSENCKQLTLYRVALGGAIVYEGRCLDGSNKDHQFSCQSYTFTHKNRVIKKEDFWTKSNKSKK